MVGNSYSPSPLSRALEAIEGVCGRIRTLVEQRRAFGRRSRRQAVLVSLIVVAGASLLVLPEPDREPASEAFALQAEAEPSAPTTNVTVVEPSYEVAAQNAERQESDGWAAAIDGAEAAATLDLSLFTRQETTTTKAPTTAAPTTAAPTTAAPTTAVPTTAAPTTAESTTASTVADGGTGDTETTDPEATTSTEMETTTTTAAPTTTADNGYVDAGHGVFVPRILLSIRWCESNDNYSAANPSSSARGAYQFLTGSWAAYGHADRYGVNQAHLASPAQQDEAALITWQRDGTRPWNASRHCWG